MESLTDWYNNRSKDNHHYLGYFRDKILLGFLIVRIGLEGIWLKMLAVGLVHRSKGIGRCLINYVLSNREKEEEIFTECLEDNIKGLNFFLHLGFKICKKDLDLGEFVLKYANSLIIK
ncbi:MAG: GNAT family N-acetyltransferase [Promethearchaeota archaeon]